MKSSMPQAPGQLGHVQRTRAHRHVLGGELVAPVGAMMPQRLRSSQTSSVTWVWNSALSYRPYCLPMRSAVLEDFRRVGVLFARHVAGFFEQRHVDERSGVAHGAGIAVPVPGAAEVAAFFQNPHVVDALFDQAGTGHQTRDSRRR